MKKIISITPSDAENGFSLAGVTQDVTDRKNSEEVLHSAMSDPETGIIIIDERLITAIGEERLRKAEKGWNGILLVLPSPERPGVEIEDYATRLIRKAIGYHIRL